MPQATQPATQPTTPTRDAGDLIAATCAGTRPSPYRFIHKALRVMLCQALLATGRLDADDAGERQRVVDEVERLLGFCADHLAHENHFLLAPLRERAPRAARAFQHDHDEHLDSIDALRLLLQRLRDADTQAPALAQQLHLRLSLFVADNLPHMVEEESTQTQALWDHFSDAELGAMLGALHASLSPAETATCVAWMARGLNTAELVQMLDEMRQGAPAPVFAEMAGLVQQTVDAPRWARVARALGLPPVPGLMTC
jgi:hypothetical protein